MLSQAPCHQALPQVIPDQDLVLQIPNLNESFEASQADLGIGGEGQRVAYGACGSQLCPDARCGCQIPKSQGPGHPASDQALLIGEQLTGEDTVLMVLREWFAFSHHLLQAQAPSLLTELCLGSPKPSGTLT